MPHVLTLFIKHKNKGNTKLRCAFALVFVVSLHKAFASIASLHLFYSLRCVRSSFMATLSASRIFVPQYRLHPPPLLVWLTAESLRHSAVSCFFYSQFRPTSSPEASG